MQQAYDRAAEDLGNSVHLEHVNVQIPDQRIAGLFYVVGLGLTRDPYLNVADNNMWVNVGRSQFHLPTGEPQVLRGHTGIVMRGPRGAAGAALERAQTARRHALRLQRAQRPRRGDLPLGQPHPLLRAGRGAVRPRSRSASPMSSSTCRSAPPRVSRAFYREMIGTPAEVANGDGTVARVKVGKQQHLLFRETDRPQPDFDEHHIQIYVADFSGPHRRLNERELVSREDNQYQYRFRDIVDLDSGRHLFTIEHEVRSLTHPMFLRPLVNRNPAQTDRNYSAGPRRDVVGDGAGSISTTSRSGRCSDSCSSGGPSRPHGEEARSAVSNHGRPALRDAHVVRSSG